MKPRKSIFDENEFCAPNYRIVTWACCGKIFDVKNENYLEKEAFKSGHTRFYKYFEIQGFIRTVTRTHIITHNFILSRPFPGFLFKRGLGKASNQ